MAKSNNNIKFQIKDDQLIVSIGIKALKRSIECDTDLIIDDELKAAISIKNKISFEEEDGRTLFHEMLASAANEAFSDGEEGFKDLD